MTRFPIESISAVQPGRTSRAVSPAGSTSFFALPRCPVASSTAATAVLSSRPAVAPGTVVGEFPFFFGDMLCMDNELHSDRFELVESLDPGQVALLSVLPLLPGDVVAFFEVSEFARATMLVHTALHVGAGLLVEKPNTEAAGEDSPYRLVTAGMVVEPLEAALLGSGLRAEVLRPRAPLRPLTEVFASSYAVRLRGLANRARRPVGMDVVPQNEYGLGGGITSEAICAVARLAVEIGPDGRGSLA